MTRDAQPDRLRSHTDRPVSDAAARVELWLVECKAKLGLKSLNGSERHETEIVQRVLLQVIDWME